jgi:hypothetical protein
MTRSVASGLINSSGWVAIVLGEPEPAGRVAVRIVREEMVQGNGAPSERVTEELVAISVLKVSVPKTSGVREGRVKVCGVT